MRPFTLKKVLKTYESLVQVRTNAVNVEKPPWKTAHPMETRAS